MEPAETSQPFCFGFVVGEARETVAQSDKHVAAQEATPSHFVPAEEVVVRDAGAQDSAPGSLENVQVTPDLSLVKVRISTADAARLTGTSEVQTSDLVPGRYEGGFKLWEGAVDLSCFLCQHFNITWSKVLKAVETGLLPSGKHERVLELGCGHGLPGILMGLMGAEVHFQDFNRSVCTQLTARNVAANVARMPARFVKSPTRYFAGDWHSFSKFLVDNDLAGSYDFVLSAETLYSPGSVESLYRCIIKALKSPQGTCYIASKSYYFGVGGGPGALRKLVEKEGLLQLETVVVLDDGTSNKREILRLCFCTKAPVDKIRQ